MESPTHHATPTTPTAPTKGRSELTEAERKDQRMVWASEREKEVVDLVVDDEDEDDEEPGQPTEEYEENEEEFNLPTKKPKSNDDDDDDDDESAKYGVERWMEQLIKTSTLNALKNNRDVWSTLSDKMKLKLCMEEPMITLLEKWINNMNDMTTTLDCFQYYLQEVGTDPDICNLVHRNEINNKWDPTPTMDRLECWLYLCTHWVSNKLITMNEQYSMAVFMLFELTPSYQTYMEKHHKQLRDQDNLRLKEIQGLEGWFGLISMQWTSRKIVEHGPLDYENAKNMLEQIVEDRPLDDENAKKLLEYCACKYLSWIGNLSEKVSK